MTTLWETVTANSSLPIASGNTFWDHLQNQQGGSGTSVFVGDILMELDAMPIIEIDDISVAVALDVAVEVDVEVITVDVEIPS
tara:strand:- start:4408 stop:4656 length:249 start_codon:yes stop_codon:yes gene_type:complete